jgi:heme-degrading monooxygenase HmoA
MIVEYIRYRIPDNDRRAQFQDAYKTAETFLEASPNCLGYEISHCVEKPEHYIVRIEWDSLDGHLKGFRVSKEFQGFFERVIDKIFSNSSTNSITSSFQSFAIRLK